MNITLDKWFRLEKEFRHYKKKASENHRNTPVEMQTCHSLPYDETCSKKSFEFQIVQQTTGIKGFT